MLKRKSIGLAALILICSLGLSGCGLALFGAGAATGAAYENNRKK